METVYLLRMIRIKQRVERTHGKNTVMDTFVPEAFG